MAVTLTTPLPAAPQRSDGPEDFSDKADAFAAALKVFQEQQNTQAGELNALAATAVAAASAAINAPGTGASSTTSLSVSTGLKTLTIQTGKLFVAGQPLLLAAANDPTGTQMIGSISEYLSGSGSLKVQVTAYKGSGSAVSPWNVMPVAPIPAIATVAQLLAGVDVSTFVNPATLIAAMAWATLSDGPTVTWDLSIGFNAMITTAGNRTIALPTNRKSGVDIVLIVKNDSVGSRTPTWAAGWDFGDDGTPSPPTAANSEMWIYGKVRADTATIAAKRIR